MPHPCTHTYESISREKVSGILDALTAHGCIVTGRNPWTVDTRKHGVILRGAWNEEASTLAISVAKADWYIPSSAIWKHIDSLMYHVQDQG
jgi:hypothetical protein